jgi:uridine kinase
MVDGDAAAHESGAVPPLANGVGTQHASDALNDDFRRLVHSSSCGASLSPLKANSDAWSPGSHSWRSSLPAGDSPGTSRASRRHRSQPFFIGVAGGTASGKTTVCDLVKQRLNDQCVVMLSQDSFYRSLTEKELENVADYDFDSPNAFDHEELVKCMQDLQAMRAVEVPEYDFVRHQRSARTQRVEPADVVIIEGILVLHEPLVCGMLNMKIFVDTDDDVRLARRIQRDIVDRGRDVAGVIQQYTRFVKPAFDTYVAPSRKHADVIVPWAREEPNQVAISLITEHIKMKLQQHDLRRIFHNLQVIPSNFQIRGMHTIIRDRTTSCADFVFYADRLLRLVVEAGLGHLPFKERTVETPTGRQYVGVDFAKKLCGVSIIRSGESMENALRACCKGIKIGKILVHRVGDAAMEQALVYEKLPRDIAERHVLLLDPMLGCGSSAVKAIEVLLEKGVEEGKIFFLTLIAAPEGLTNICRRYPKVTLVTSEIDEGVGPGYQVVPGCGGFGDRYFCE